MTKLVFQPLDLKKLKYGKNGHTRSVLYFCIENYLRATYLIEKIGFGKKKFQKVWPFPGTTGIPHFLGLRKLRKPINSRLGQSSNMAH